MIKSSENSFAGKKIQNFKQKFIYPTNTKVRFQVTLDKNGQVHDIVQTFPVPTKDPVTKKKYIAIRLGDRPRALFDRIHGRPFLYTTTWIEETAAQMAEAPVPSEE